MSDHQIELFKVRMSPAAKDLVNTVLFSGQIAQGRLVDQFESELDELLKVPKGRAVTVNSGTSALHLAYHLAGVRRGDIVLASPMTCAATITPLVQMGAIPIWVDVDPLTGNLDPLAIARTYKWLGTKYSSTTRSPRALVAVDWAGVPADTSMIRAFLSGRIPIIEDAAHAMLARHPGGGSIGSFAETDGALFVCYSLQAIKHLTTGDGGILVCPNNELTARARRLRWFGLDRTSKVDFRAGQDIAEAGYKYHLNDIAAAIGLANLGALRGSVHLHHQYANTLFHALGDLAPRVKVAPFHEGGSYWIYTLLVDNRESFEAWMREKAIAVSQVHRRNDQHTAFRDVAPEQPPLPGLDKFAAHQVSIPCGWWLSTADLDRIIDAVRSWARLGR